MEFVRGIKCRQGSVLILPDDSVVQKVQESLGVHVGRMKMLEPWSDFVKYVTFDNATIYNEESGTYVSAGGFKVDINFETKSISYSNSKEMQIMDILEIKSCLKIITINGLFMSTELRDRMVAAFWISSGRNFFTLIARSAKPLDVLRLCSTNQKLKSWCDASFYADMLQHHFGERNDDPKGRFKDLTLKRKRVIAFFERHLDVVNWRRLSSNTAMSEAFFERHLGYVDWMLLSGNTAMSEAFWERHLENVDWVSLCINTAMSEAFWERHLENAHMGWLSRNPAMSEAFWERHLAEVNWTQLSDNSVMSEAFWERHLELVNWNSLSGNTAMSEAFFERHLKLVEWTELSDNTAMSEAFFERHLDRVAWSQLSSNTAMSEAFFERHLANANWVRLSANNFGLK